MKLISRLLVVLSMSAMCAAASGTEDRNLAVQKTLYTKIRNQLTLGEDVPGSLFVMLNPGIVLDPNWDLSKVGDQQKFARLLIRALKPSWLYRTSSVNLDSLYSDVLAHHNTGRAKLSIDDIKQLEKERDDARKVLYRDKKGTPTALHERYLDLKRKYGQALLTLEYEQLKAGTAGTPLDPRFQDDVDAIYNDWTGQPGQKDVVEGALDTYRQVNEILNPAAWWTELQNQYNANTSTGPSGRFRPTVVDDDYKTLFSEQGWMDLVLKDADVTTTTYHEHTSMSVGGAAGWGLWSVHVGGEFQEDKGHSLSDAKDLMISFQVRRTGLSYPWMNADLFYNHGWRWAPGWGGTRLSDGGNVPTTLPKGRLTLIPTSLVISRKVKVIGTWNTTEVNTYSSMVKSNASVGWGPWSVGGSYSKTIESGTSHGQVTATGFEAPDVQVIGMFCDVLPRTRIQIRRLTGCRL